MTSRHAAWELHYLEEGEHVFTLNGAKLGVANFTQDPGTRAKFPDINPNAKLFDALALCEVLGINSPRHSLNRFQKIYLKFNGVLKDHPEFGNKDLLKLAGEVRPFITEASALHLAHTTRTPEAAQFVDWYYSEGQGEIHAHERAHEHAHERAQDTSTGPSDIQQALATRTEERDQALAQVQALQCKVEHLKETLAKLPPSPNEFTLAMLDTLRVENATLLSAVSVFQSLAVDFMTRVPARDRGGLNDRLVRAEADHEFLKRRYPFYTQNGAPKMAPDFTQALESHWAKRHAEYLEDLARNQRDLERLQKERQP